MDTKHSEVDNVESLPPEPDVLIQGKTVQMKLKLYLLKFQHLPDSFSVREKLNKWNTGFRNLQYSWWLWWASFSVVTILALITRLHYLTVPHKVVWDEAHFGKMVSWYLNRTYFFDVHPCGGKLLLTLFGYLGGYNGTFGFEKPADVYDGYEGIMAMRLGCALMGVGIVCLAFMIVWILTHSVLGAVFASSLIICDIGTMTLTKFILLDAPLMFFIMAAFLGLCLMHSYTSWEFSSGWWSSYSFTGVMLGCVISVKFVGIFVVLVVGTYAALDLWTLYGQVHRTLREVLAHLAARILSLILLPSFVYVALFCIHDAVIISTAYNTTMLNEGVFSAGYQMNLEGNPLYNLSQPKYISYGSKVTLKSSLPVTMYVSTFNVAYNEKYAGSKDKLLTCGTYGFRNNYHQLLVLYPDFDPDLPDALYSGEVDKVINGDIVRLYHPISNSTIACDKRKAITSTKHFLVYGHRMNLSEIDEAYKEVNTSNYDTWQVNIVGGIPDQPVSSMTDNVQFLCGGVRCALTYTTLRVTEDEKYNSPEITCSKNLKDPRTYFYFEQNQQNQLPNVSYTHLRTGFWERFYETHKVILTINSNLKPPSSYRVGEHRPWMWPLGIKAHMWYDVGFRILLFANPYVIWLNLFVLLVTPALIIAHEYRKIRRTLNNKPLLISNNCQDPVFAMGWLMYSYIMHYIPFFTMTRMLYYHHYFPAMLFSSMLTGVVLSYAVNYCWSYKDSLFKQLMGYLLSIFIISMSLYSFSIYCYIGYGHPTSGPFNLKNSTYKDVRLFDEWSI